MQKNESTKKKAGMSLLSNIRCRLAANRSSFRLNPLSDKLKY